MCVFRINVTVRRNGGGFGGKATRNLFLSVATGMAARILRKPVKMHMSFWDNQRMIGKRAPYYVKYQAGMDNNGKLLGIIMDIYRNNGAHLENATKPEAVLEWIQNGYYCPAWKISLTGCKTNTPLNSWCRAPGSLEAIYFIEYLMEHAASVMKKSSIELKTLNFMKDGDVLLDNSILSDCTIAPITKSLLESSYYDARVAEAKKFNEYNRWRKRGLGVVPCRWPTKWNPFSFSCTVSIYHDDGSVAIAHGGVEFGQGINTKVMQVVAHELGIDIKKVLVQPTTSMSGANNFPTSGSITSELVALAAIDCCSQLKNRMGPIREANPGDSWETLVEKCWQKAIDLSARGWGAPRTKYLAAYSVYGAMVTEVEMDVLTGEYQINRLDVLYDCGESMSPLIDIGQVEGGIVMGLGYYTSEEIVFDEKSGNNMDITTWTYKPPTAKDIPIDFRITLLPNAPNPSGILRSKCVGEPPVCMSVSVVFALKDAISASRKETTTGDAWWQIDSPVTVAKAQQYCGTEITQLIY